MSTRANLKAFFDEEYVRDVENLRNGLKPPAALSAESKIAKVLELLGVPSAGLPLAWTFRSKGTRYFEKDGSVLLTETSKPLTIGRRCAMYVCLPCPVPSLGLSAGDYLGVVGDVSTQSTNVSTVVYFLVVPCTEKIWSVVGVLDAIHNRIDLSREAIKHSMEAALNRSNRLKENRALARQKNAAAASSAPAPRNIRRRVERSVPAVVVQPAPAVVVQPLPEPVVSSENAAPAPSLPPTVIGEQKSDFESEGDCMNITPVFDDIRDTQNDFVFSPAESYGSSDVFAQHTYDVSNDYQFLADPFPADGFLPNTFVFSYPEEAW